jgi:hypothetical protein
MNEIVELLNCKSNLLTKIQLLSESGDNRLDALVPKCVEQLSILDKAIEMLVDEDGCPFRILP